MTGPSGFLYCLSQPRERGTNPGHWSSDWLSPVEVLEGSNEPRWYCGWLGVCGRCAGGFKGDEERRFEAAEVHALTFSSPVSDSLEAVRMTA